MHPNFLKFNLYNKLKKIAIFIHSGIFLACYTKQLNLNLKLSSKLIVEVRVNFNVQPPNWLIYGANELNIRKKMILEGRNSIVEKQLQKIFDCLNEPEAFAKIQAKYIYHEKFI